MGNIASEVGRSFAAKYRNDDESCDSATMRAIDLFDATTEQLTIKHSPQLKEVLRSKEIYLDAIYNKELKKIDADSIEKYFMQYAIAARLNK